MPPLRSWLRRIPREAHLRRRAFVAVLVFLLSFVPMAGTLGYFSGFLLAPVLSLLAAAAGVDAVMELRERAGDATSHDAIGTLWRLAGAGAVELGWLLGLSLGLLILGMLWTINCDPIGGAAYFFMGPACSATLGWFAGVGAAVLVGRRRRIVTLLAGWTPFLLCVIVGLRRIYAEPVVFAYDPFFGWFSGPIYDEGVSISARYLSFRAYNFTVAAALWLLLRAGADAELRLSARRMIATGPARLRSAAAALLLLVALAVGLSAPRLGFTATTQSLSRVLAGTEETEHFVIHYGPTSLTAREIEAVAAEHEFAWHELEQRLGSAPTRKVHSFIFASGKQRGALIGANRVEVSPPWRQQMYLSHRPWPHEVMHHELAHAFLGDVGDPLLGLPISGLRVSGALVEGVPTALAPRAQDNLGLHEQAAILDRLNKRPPLARIMGAGFWGAAASRAYAASGSFVLWLAQSRGWPSVAALYRNAGDFAATYDAELPELEAAWLEFLRALPLREQDIEAQAQRYQRSSVFRRPCAHRAAELSAEASRARLLGQVDEALEHQRTLCRIEPEEPGHSLRLADMLAGWERYEDAAAELDALAQRDALTATIRAIIEEQRGDTALVAGALDEAAARYDAALELGLGEDRRRQLQIKRRAAGDPALAPLVVDYFRPFQADDDSRADALLRVWAATRIAGLDEHAALGDYLLGRQLLNIAAPAEAAEALAPCVDDEGERGGLWTVEMRRAALLALLSARTQIQDWTGARALLGPLDTLAEGEGHRAEIEQWRARIEFFAGYFASAD